MANKKNFFTIDFVKKTITGTKTSFNKAGKGFDAEYKELATKIAAHPDFTLTVKEQKSKSTKKKTTYHGLNFALIEGYLSIQENAEQLTKEYEAVKKMAKNCGSKVYPITKKWFLGKFEKFDVDEAKIAISDFRIAQAEKSVAEIIVNENNQPATAA